MKNHVLSIVHTFCYNLLAAADRIGSRDGKNIFLVSDTIASLLEEKVHEIISKHNCLLTYFFEGFLKVKFDKKVLAIYII